MTMDVIGVKNHDRTHVCEGSRGDEHQHQKRDLESLVSVTAKPVGLPHPVYRKSCRYSVALASFAPLCPSVCTKDRESLRALVPDVHEFVALVYAKAIGLAPNVIDHGLKEQDRFCLR